MSVRRRYIPTLSSCLRPGWLATRAASGRKSAALVLAVSQQATASNLLQAAARREQSKSEDGVGGSGGRVGGGGGGGEERGRKIISRNLFFVAHTGTTSWRGERERTRGRSEQIRVSE